MNNEQYILMILLQLLSCKTGRGLTELEHSATKKSGIRGVDRIVPIGKTMDFDLRWIYFV